MTWYELIGYVASALVALSLMMSSILRLRIINLTGAALFALYGVLIGAIPVAVVNLFIVGINVFHLNRIARVKEYLHLLEVAPDSEYLLHFLELSRADIERYQPGALTLLPERQLPDTPARHLIVFVLRDVVPAGLLVGEVRAGDALHVQLDYVLPGYRDLKIGEFLFQQRAAFFRERGIQRIVARATTREHATYLERMGFAPTGGGEYTRAIAPHS